MSMAQAKRLFLLDGMALVYRAHFAFATKPIRTSTGFNTRFWKSNGGLPHTEALTLTERFKRVSKDVLEYEVTIDDPRTYTRPWKAAWTLRWVPGDIQEQFCETGRE